MTEPDSNTSINAERGNPTDQAVASYLAGDPLRDLEALRRLELVLVRGRERGIAADSAVPRLEGEQPSS